MSEAKGQQHEPSMEEILASIRRIIAEDGDTAAPPAAAKPAEKPAPAPEPEPPEEEVLELTEVVEPDGSVVSLAAAAAERAAEAAAPPPSPTPLVQTEEPLRRPELVPPPPPPAPSEQIVSPATAAASVASLAQLTALPGRGERSDIPLGAGHLTLEMLVREELRPILKDWLDRNLPDMVERIVKAEIARLVHDVQRR
jgi:cell pole-organizing protein PopZ